MTCSPTSSSCAALRIMGLARLCKPPSEQEAFQVGYPLRARAPDPSTASSVALEDQVQKSQLLFIRGLPGAALAKARVEVEASAKTRPLFAQPWRGTSGRARLGSGGRKPSSQYLSTGETTIGSGTDYAFVSLCCSSSTSAHQTRFVGLGYNCSSGLPVAPRTAWMVVA